MAFLRPVKLRNGWRGKRGEIALKFNDLHRIVKIRIFVMFLFGTAQATTTPFMAIYFAKNFGSALAGVLLTVSIAASLLSGLVGGYYADRIGRRKLMILSELVFLIAYLAMAAGNSPWLNSPGLAFASFMVTNVCWGVYGPADEAMLLDVTEPSQRQYVYGLFYWMFNLTMALGASLGAALFESFRFELFAAGAVVLVITLITTVAWIQETYRPPSEGSERLDSASRVPMLFGIVRSYAGVLKDKTFLTYTLAGMLGMAVEFQLPNYIGIHLESHLREQVMQLFGHPLFHVDGVKMIGLLQTENTVLVVLFAGLATRLAQRSSERTVLFIGVLFNVMGYTLMILTQSPAALALLMLFSTLGEVYSVPVRQAYLGDLAPVHARSSYLAVNGMTFGGSRVLASLGVVVGAYLPVWGMGVLSLTFGFIAVVLYQVIVPHVHTRRLAEQNPQCASSALA